MPTYLGNIAPKVKILSLAFSSFIFAWDTVYLSPTQAQSAIIHVECPQNFRQIIQNKIPNVGNSGSNSLTLCSLDLSKEKSIATIQARFHGKQRTCKSKPWPIRGKWCWDTYNFWTTLTARGDLGPGCKVQNLDIQKSDTSATGIPYEEAVLAASKKFYDHLKGDKIIEEIVNLSIQENSLARDFCSQ